MHTEFTVVSCNPSNEGKTFVAKLEAIFEATLFGTIKKSVKRTFYVGGLPQVIEAGTKLKDDLKNYDIVERPFERTNEETGEVETIMLKWLHVKVGA